MVGYGTHLKSLFGGRPSMAQLPEMFFSTAHTNGQLNSLEGNFVHLQFAWASVHVCIILASKCVHHLGRNFVPQRCVPGSTALSGTLRIHSL